MMGKVLEHLWVGMVEDNIRKCVVHVISANGLYGKYPVDNLSHPLMPLKFSSNLIILFCFQF